MFSVNAQQKSQASSASQRAAKNINGAGLSRRNLSRNHLHHHPAPPLPHSALATIASSSSTPSVTSPASPASELHHQSSGSRLYDS
ncbi:hypothetical protein PGT21_011579 [Puccinia graminis f. sp. tritici]|uniref:Uncharacterized protein n=1 Tax=Puccinia graminis f. sp. tritici TaxID=56615 RepID=A0A5B0RH85_PUCGR|nr:hypothetical protein PGT21_011579 [Puccinia graminis f. sp. tritici]KAA1124822.1 hypothetical protein PGTUg99_035506 [Puccinia graminis f. sp. tritici]